MTYRKLRVAAATALVGIVGGSVAAVGATAGGNGPSSAQSQYKVTICHMTGSESNPSNTISVSNAALPAHLAHGDTLGPCPD
jgi:hypothetical protein